MTSVAVIILNYNGENLLPTFLPSVVAHSPEAKITVVDNGSTDASVALLKKSFPQIELLTFQKNLGFCGGYNAAINLIDSEIVVLLNSDVEVTENWLRSPIQWLNSNPSIAAIQPKILSHQNRNQFEYAGAAGGYIDALGYPFCRGRIFKTLEKDEGQYNDSTDIFWASGACLIIKRKIYLELGGFDEDFFAHMEEIDLCWRLNRAGYSILYDGKSEVYHLGGGTLSKDNPKKVYFNFKNGLSLLVKNLPILTLTFYFPTRIILDWLAALYFSIQGSWGSALAVLKAHLHFLVDFKKDLRKRKRNKPLGYRVKPGLILNKSIVLDYFFRSRRTYGQIKNPR